MNGWTRVLFVATVIGIAGCGRGSPTAVEPDAVRGDSVAIALPDRTAAPGSSTRFAYGQCTWYSASEFDKVAPSPGCNWGGNAGTWADNVTALTWREGNYLMKWRVYRSVTDAGSLALPSGTIICWKGGSYGHVAVLRQVVQNGIYFQEMNWPLGSGVSSLKYLTWPQVLARGSYSFSGYIAPRKYAVACVQ
jgi:surface antigen